MHLVDQISWNSAQFNEKEGGHEECVSTSAVIPVNGEQDQNDQVVPEQQEQHVEDNQQREDEQLISRARAVGLNYEFAKPGVTETPDEHRNRRRRNQRRISKEERRLLDVIGDLPPPPPPGSSQHEDD